MWEEIDKIRLTSRLSKSDQDAIKAMADKKMQLGLFDDEQHPETPATPTHTYRLKELQAMMLNRWIEFARPAWLRIYRESVAAGDTGRSDYAKKLLINTLGVDPATIS